MLTSIARRLIGTLVVVGTWLADGAPPRRGATTKARLPRVFGWLPLTLAAVSFATMTYLATH